MSEGQEVAKGMEGGDKKKEPDPCNRVPGFCSAACVNKACLREVNKRPLPKTSEVYTTCNLPKRFDHPHWFNGYGSQVNSQHPFYRTSASEYGWFPPGIHSVPSVFYPASQTFSSRLFSFGMYRNYSLNTALDPSDYS